MKIEGACHPVISECPFNSRIWKQCNRQSFLLDNITPLKIMAINTNKFLMSRGDLYTPKEACNYAQV